jgi:Family of unknown function (DUF6183)
MRPSLDALIEAQDFNALLRAVDAACEQRDWDALVDLADRCEEAAERGKQMWPIAAHIDYRLALEAPGEYAALALHPEVGRFAHGPLTEVAASTHQWADLADHLQEPQVAAYVAQERVLRGEDLRGDERAHPEALELPLQLVAWEPTYALATFKATYVEVAEPWEPRAPLKPVPLIDADAVDDDELTDALVDLVAPWTAESNGAARAAVVEGDARAAASCLTFGALRLGRLTTEEAVQRMAWAAASGGAHGRRRGAALGRFLAWYTGAVVCGERWPPDPDALGAALHGLRWFRWDEGSPEEGWVLRLAVEDSSEGWAAAIAATDVEGPEVDDGDAGPRDAH